jgi:hypothetical protein
MYFAEFYNPGALNKDQLFPACGDRGVYILDGRNTRTTQIEDARSWAQKHGFHGFKICVGDTFTRARPLTGLILT